MLLRTLSKTILRNHKAWLQIYFLVFASLPDFLTKQTTGVSYTGAFDI